MIIVEIAGHLGRDPETRFTTTGQKVTTLTVATNVRRSGKDETVWWRVTLWGDRFEKMLPYLKKGSPVIAIGEMQAPQIYTDKEGKPQVSMELTAEILKFSPFGRPDRPDQAAGQQSATSEYGSNPQPNARPNQASGNSQPFAGSPNYGQAQSLSGAAGHAGTEDEDPLPF